MYELHGYDNHNKQWFSVAQDESINDLIVMAFTIYNKRYDTFKIVNPNTLKTEHAFTILYGL